jgi:uncharacterized membrane protein
MADFERLLNRWQSAGVLDAEAAARIRAYESEQSAPAGGSREGMSWQGKVALILGAILLACGVVLFVSAHWDWIGPGWRFALVIAMVTVFHLAGAYARLGFHGLSTALHGVGTVATGAAIALVGQIFNMQEHWPAAVLLWAAAALAGWILLRDEAQEILTLLLFPAWIYCEFSFAAQGHIGANVYLGRFLIAWGVLYLTLFLGSKHRIVEGVLFATGAIAASVGIVMTLDSWQCWSASQTFLPFHLRAWGWLAIAALPLMFSFFRMRKSLEPVAVAIALSVALPWCIRIRTQHFDYGTIHTAFIYVVPNLLAYALVAGFTIFIVWWGMRQASHALVNLGVVGFAVTVAWFYWSDIFDKMGRSLGLIGLGVLFLAGGWALEKAHRGLMARMDSALAQKEMQ